MENTEVTLETGDALAMVNLTRQQWNSFMTRDLYEGAPPVEAGHPRYFTVDGMVALFVRDHFVQQGTTR